MFERLRAVWNPAMYHGTGRRSRFFEGWYFKSVAPAGDAVIAVIPGVSIPAEGEPHAFVQVLDGLNRTSTYHRYRFDEFDSSRDRFDIHIGPNHFSLDRISLDIPGAVRGELRFSSVRSWPVRLLAPGVMGWYALVPAMECYHGVLSFNHRIEGELAVDERRVDFTGGKGYIEKDWGRSFPTAWVWMQTNHFSEPEASLTLSVAHIPWLGSFFTGHIVGLWLRGRLHRFATYTGARLTRLEVRPDEVELAVEDQYHVLEVRCRRHDGAVLAAPSEGAMTGRIAEAMTSEPEVRLLTKNRRGRTETFREIGRYAGLEVAGDTDCLNAGLK